ncbi:hypothetical protein C8Q77DRAFT_558614 [Trametes polyzona]|nr:hypothetical protein C8Q77DRAFT_558614 [Trametes polyzona]
MPTRLLVKPTLPSILQDQCSVKLPGFELWMTYIENVTVIPTRIDLALFTAALSEALRIYPHAAGQLSRHGDDWEIALTNPAVPIEVSEVETTSVEVADPEWVIQQNLRRFLASNRPAGQSPVPEPELGARESRLLLLKVTIAREETAIGVSWHHTLGDAITLNRFMQCLSRCYQAEDIGDLVPTFAKRPFPSPTPDLVERYSVEMPHLLDTCPTSELAQRYADMKTNDVAPVQFKISNTQLQQLKEQAQAALSHTDAALSSQDVLTAYIISVLNRFLDSPITAINNAASYRDVPDVVYRSNVAGNAIYIIRTVLPNAELRIPEIALPVPHSISRWRSPTIVEEYMAVASSLMLSAVNHDCTWMFSAPPGLVSVKSNTSIDWRAAHFGHPLIVRFYTSGTNDRYVRVFRSNPARPRDRARQPDIGTNAAMTSEDSWDVFFAISRNIRRDVVDAIEADLCAPEFPYNLIPVASSDPPPASE